MHHRPLAIALALPALFGFTAAAMAFVPSAQMSTVPSCMHACPFGDLSYSVTIRDIAGNPIPGSTVEIEFGGCPNFHLCPPEPSPAYTVETPTRIALTTNAQGQATFPLEVSGTCANAVMVYADGVTMTDGVSHAPASLANTDQDGDFFVTGNDVTLCAAKGPADPTADFDCDGDHDAADDAIESAHNGHFCRDFIDPVLPRSWGGLKIRYR